MRKLTLGLIVSLSLAGVVHAQVAAVQRAGFNLPAGQVAAPNTPGGAAVIFNSLFVSDGAQGLRHYRPADPTNPDPINSGIFVFDSFNSFGGGGLCFPVCHVGQVVVGGPDSFGDELVFIASYDHSSGGGGGLTTPGVLRVTIQADQGDGAPGPMGWSLLAPGFGLAGDLPSALALGPDGNLYVGFLKNGNVKRIVNPYLDGTNKAQIVQSVGGIPNGRPARAFTFVGSDLYIAYTEGLAVIHSATATTCQGGCNATVVPDGFPGQNHVGLTADAAGHLYVAINGNGVWRYTLANGAMTQVSTGGNDPNTGAPLTFAFVGGHTNLLQVDAIGNLWIGDDTSDGTFNFTGRIWSISAGALAQIP
jgi:hypothetical protein